MFVLGTELDAHKVGPALVARIRGGHALQFTQEIMDLKEIARVSGKDYLMREFDRLYLRPDFERIFTSLVKWNTFSRSTMKTEERGSAHDTNEFDRFINKWMGFRSALLDVAGGTRASPPDWVQAMHFVRRIRLCGRPWL